MSISKFQSTHPVRGATADYILVCPLIDQFQSTHPVRGATIDSGLPELVPVISIHAPRAGCDVGVAFAPGENKYFNPRTPCGVRLFWTRTPQAMRLISIHAPRAGCDRTEHGETVLREKFQSTHPVRGATKARVCHPCQRAYFNPRTPCGVRRTGCCFAAENSTDFNPRTPCGVRPRGWTVTAMPKNFNPRTPCGVRQSAAPHSQTRSTFQSTHPVRGATSARRSRARSRSHFNPRTPCGVRRLFPLANPTAGLISIHAPRAGCDGGGQCRWEITKVFQSTHPVRGATKRALAAIIGHIIFQSTHPVRGATGAEIKSADDGGFQSTHPVRGATIGYA